MKMDEMMACIREYGIGDWMIWAGAGVSVSSPTNLPLGEALTTFVLESACGHEPAQRLIRTWRAIREHCLKHEPGIPFASLPRLESVLGAIAKAESVAPDELQFLSAFRSLSHVPANPNHVLLATLILRGATVLTTNFDMAIQAAFESMEPPIHCEALPGTGLYRPYRPKGVDGAGVLVHVHGSADAPEDLGATIQRVKQGLEAPVASLLDHGLSRGAVLVFVGYSASDAFDVTPWFDSRPERTWPRSTMIFVQHGSYPPPPQADALKIGFGRSIVANADTTGFLEELAGTRPAATGGGFDWRGEFLAGIPNPVDAPAKALFTCAVCNELGMNLDLVDETAYEAAQAGYGARGTGELRAILSLAARGQGKSEEEKRQLELAGLGSDDLIFYHYSRGDHRAAARLAMPIDEILKRGEITGEIDWKPYTSMSLHIRRFLRWYLRFPDRRPDTADEKGRLERLVRVTEVLSARNLADLQAIHQVATALRFNLLLKALLGTADRQTEERVLRLYAEQAMVQGFVSSWRDFAFARVFRLRHDGAEAGLQAEADALLDASHELAVLIGDQRAQRSAAKARRYLRAHRR